MISQKQKYKKAIKKYIRSIENDKEIIGILVCGSYVHSDLDENSDVDIHLVLDGKCNYRERGNTWIDGVEIEYFKNPPQQIRSYFEKEKESPHTADMFVHSIVEYKSSEIIDDLIEEAKKIIEEKPPKLINIEIEISKYFLDDLHKDLKDCVKKNDKLGCYLVKSKIIDRCIFVLCKLKRIRRAKEKRLFTQVRETNREFAKKIENAVNEDLLLIEKTKDLIRYTENLLGGQRKREWKLKSKLDL